MGRKGVGLVRLIDADAVLDRYYADWEYHCITMAEDDRQWLRQCIDHAPTIDAVPVVHGRWTLNPDGSGTCNQCHRTQKNVGTMTDGRTFAVAAALRWMVKRMYKAPIELITRDIVRQFVERVDGEVFNTVTQYGITVDKEELLKALAYDREQYEKGYGDGYRAAKDEIVRCKDCEYWMYEYDDVGLCAVDVPDTDGVERHAFDFCSYGERKKNAENH